MLQVQGLQYNQSIGLLRLIVRRLSCTSMRIRMRIA